MAGFLYFAAGVQSVNRENVDRLTGLGYAFDDKLAHVPINGNNPSGQGGCVFGDASLLPPGEKLGMYVDRQTWRKMPTASGPELWLGYWTEHPPQPEELRRDTKLRTTPVELDDGRAWAVPIVGHFEQDLFESELPAYVDIDDQGRRVRGEPLAEYRGLWEHIAGLADKYFQFAARKGDEPTDDEQWDAAVALLQATYRVGPVELVTMRAFIDSADKVTQVWTVATAYKWLMQVVREMADESSQKKTQASAGDGANTSAGEAG